LPERLGFIKIFSVGLELTCKLPATGILRRLEVFILLAADELLVCGFLQVEVEEIVEVVAVVEHAWLDGGEVGLGPVVL